MSRSSVGIKECNGARTVIVNRENLVLQEWKYLENNDKPKVVEAAGM